jgi:hypothetical protein
VSKGSSCACRIAPEATSGNAAEQPGPQDYSPAAPAKGPAFTISARPAEAAATANTPGPADYITSAPEKGLPRQTTRSSLLTDHLSTSKICRYAPAPGSFGSWPQPSWMGTSQSKFGTSTFHRNAPHRLMPTTIFCACRACFHDGCSHWWHSCRQRRCSHAARPCRLPCTSEPPTLC